MLNGFSVFRLAQLSYAPVLISIRRQAGSYGGTVGAGLPANNLGGREYTKLTVPATG